MKRLTAKQQQIYDYIALSVQERGYPPSVREIGEAVGLKSPSTVHFHLKALERDGLLEKDAGKGRAISLTGHGGEPDKVPLLGNVAAGSPILAEELVEEYITFDTGGLSGEHFALRVRGESMIDAGILPGDLVVVHRQNTAQNGEIVVALLEDEATVKRLSRKNGKILLVPENPDYEPIDGTGAEILGKVTAVLRYY
ncbi:transcriptional repressor LexA [Papillibacter cinnamivorans]|uniref:LexA repressor n=1 Tax=Papillibacter cinnamivorans DSM 12816 TaxID=1122930 RepID=A0A1W2CSK0_9FIRM|nr:transcriptional repressor LexA [Papillibacter cinnamivorans]SMC87648.1 repressor LexA [Papillibacter cinnamivorans DSM 12816]